VIKIKNRLSSEQGFTLIELLVVIVILGILVAIAVPSYLSFRGNASQAAAQANVRSAIPAAEGYFQSPTAGNGSYTGISASQLQAQAPGISPTIVVESLNGGAGYCLSDTNGPKAAYYIGGAPTLTAGGGANGVLSTVTTGYVCAAKTGFTALSSTSLVTP
jgi:type IV pilus assembly protein PilA